MSTVPPAIDAFQASLKENGPPHGCRAELAALWWARRDDWNAAHELVQDAVGSDAAWVHAWLHRAEGDGGNAGYWYRRASRPVGRGSIEDEWAVIAEALLGDGHGDGQ